MSRADDLQASAERCNEWDKAFLLTAVPDLLAVVRAAQNMTAIAESLTRSSLDSMTMQRLYRAAQQTRAALAAFEEGGR